MAFVLCQTSCAVFEEPIQWHGVCQCDVQSTKAVHGLSPIRMLYTWGLVVAVSGDMTSLAFHKFETC